MSKIFLEMFSPLISILGFKNCYGMLLTLDNIIMYLYLIHFLYVTNPFSVCFIKLTKSKIYI